MSGGLDELYGDESAATTADVVTQTPTEVAQTEPAVSQEPAPSEAQAPVETPAAASTEPQSDRDRDIAGLIRALQDERDQKKAAREEAARHKAWRDAQERKAQEAANQLPHPLDDPEGFANGVRGLTNNAVRQVQSQWQAQQDRVVETLSRNALKRHIGPEQFTELEQFAQAAPDRAHDLAYESGDPWGWMYEKLQEAKKHRQAQSALQALGDKSLDERIAEAKAQAIAEARAQWEAEHGGGQPRPVAQPAADARQRNPDGTFAPSQPEQRHRPESLSKMNGAAVIAASTPGSALDELYG